MTALRPRSVGEIYDRGFTIFVRAFWRSAAILALVACTSGAFAYGFAATPPPSRSVFVLVCGVAAVPFLLVIAGAFFALYSAEAVGTPIDVRSALTLAARRSLPMFGVTLLTVLLFGAGVVLLGAIAFGFATLVALPKLTGAAALVLSLALGIPLLAVTCFLYGICSMTVNVWWCACVAEELGPITAFRRAVSRCWTRHRMVPAAAVGFTGVALSFAVAMVLTLLESIFTESAFWLFAVQQILNAPVAGLTIAWACVYSLDARIRLEGLDLQVEAKRLG